MPESIPKQQMIKTSIDLTAEQYHFLKMKALNRKMRGEDPSFVTIIREVIEKERTSKEPILAQSFPRKKPKERMIKTSIDLTAEHYHFLKMKALERKMRGADPSFVAILRELIEEDSKNNL